MKTKMLDFLLISDYNSITIAFNKVIAISNVFVSPASIIQIFKSGLYSYVLFCNSNFRKNLKERDSEVKIDLD